MTIPPPATPNPATMESEFANQQIAWMHQIDQCLSHIWMVRAFLKHSEEAAEDDELAEVHRELYDYMLALGPSLDRGDASKYLRIAQKKFSKLRKSMEWFVEFQPEISGHMNFRMAAKSLQLAVGQIDRMLREVDVFQSAQATGSTTSTHAHKDDETDEGDDFPLSTSDSRDDR